MVTTEPGNEILVKEMQPYTQGVFPELMRNPFLYTPRHRKKIITSVVSYIRTFCPEGDEILIESNFMAITPWAELIAEKLKARNFIFLIQEDYNIRSRKLLDFFSFKYDRRELAVNTKTALQILFRNYRNIPEDDDRCLSAYCSNVVEECQSILGEKLKEADYNIGSIGRINKPFVLPMVQDLIEYVKTHPQLRFNLVFFGGSPYPNEVESIRNVCETIGNLNLVITGPLFPIPLCDVKKMDVCISSAGACWSATDAGVPTISIDANDFKPIGIIRITTENSIHRGDIPPIPIGELLDDILINHKYDGVLSTKTVDYFRNFEGHEKMIKSAKSNLEYYSVKRTAPNLLSRLIRIALGDNATRRLSKFLH
ncbi:MAG: hypothetical protein NC453_11930 [Muribaculum sp.]|nr:hypothetical protein [Muribaculum sp.]